MDQRISRTDALGQTESYFHDVNGNVTQFIDRRGKVTVYQYDELNRRIFAGFGKNGSSYESTIGYTHGGGNRLTQAMDSIAGTISRSYDGLDRLMDEQTPQGEVSYSYDAAGRRSTMQVLGQSQVAYTWDSANRLSGITQGASSVGFGYDNAGRRTTLTLPNGVIISYGYDANSRITQLSYGTGGAGSSDVGTLTYTYDANGRVISKGGTLAATGIPANVNGDSFDADNAMRSFNGQTLTYDLDGNLIGDGTKTYTWDARNHLTAIGGSVIANFVYDAFGRRMKKTVGGTTTQFLYDGLNPVRELDGAIPANVTANLLTGLGIDERFTRTDSSSAANFLTDNLGTVIALTGSTGSLATSYTYEPFGSVAAAGNESANSYQFTGRENDGTGLNYYRARYYNPTTQRFVSQDPLEFGGGDMNLYAYVGNQPTDLRDPKGTQVGLEGVCEENPQLCNPTWWWDLAKAGAAAAAAGATAIAGYCAASQSRPGKWTCKGRCQVVPYKGGGDTTYGQIALGTGNSYSQACQDAKNKASNLSPLGSYSRHCQCFDCKKR
jgi:RHS repeat-associated protein